MPRKTVADLITDQEMAFARLVLGGAMTDREAAQAAGLNPDTAAYTKAKPRVREYMLQHRAAVQQQLVAQEAEELRQRNLRRERLLGRLWAIADAGPETTRGTYTSQVKALAMIEAMDGFIADRRPGSSTSLQRAEKESTPSPVKAQIYQAAWLREQQEKAIDPEPSPEHAQQEEEPGPAEPQPAPEPTTPAATLDPLAPERTSWVPDAAVHSPDAPDIRAPFWMQQQKRFGRRR
jgi:phage terminase small subunit